MRLYQPNSDELQSQYIQRMSRQYLTFLACADCGILADRLSLFLSELVLCFFEHTFGSKGINLSAQFILSVYSNVHGLIVGTPLTSATINAFREAFFPGRFEAPISAINSNIGNLGINSNGTALGRIFGFKSLGNCGKIIQWRNSSAIKTYLLPIPEIQEKENLHEHSQVETVSGETEIQEYQRIVKEHQQLFRKKLARIIPTLYFEF
jgi:hypothetical protein